MVTDPISDYLTRLRNAIAAKHKVVEIPGSNVKKAMTKILMDQGYILNYKFTKDNKQGIIKIALKGSLGKKYCIGSEREISNINLVKIICQKVDYKILNKEKSEHLIEFVKDRLGHDYRYSIDTSMLRKELGWEAQTDLEIGLEKTISWYVDNINWLIGMKIKN